MCCYTFYNFLDRQKADNNKHFSKCGKSISLERKQLLLEKYNLYFSILQETVLQNDKTKQIT